MGNTNTARDFVYDYDFLKTGHTCCKYSLFTFDIGKPVSPRFGQMTLKIQDWEISPRDRVYHLHKSVPFTEK